MLLPIGDEPNPRGTPWVNYGLILANVGVFLVVTLPLMMRPADPNDPLTQALLRSLVEANPDVDPNAVAYHFLRGRTAYDVFLLYWGYRPAAPSVIALFSSMFLHGSWLHLLGNMLFLWIYGDNVEHALGRLSYLGAYLASGLIAAVGYGLFVPAGEGSTPMVGASGAISGVLGFYFVWFPRNRVRLLLFPLFFLVWRVPARLVIGFFVIVDNLLPFLTQRQSGVAYGAHLGGFVAGVAGALVVNQWNRHRCRKSAAGCNPGEDEASTTVPLAGGPAPVDGEESPGPSPLGRGAEAVVRHLEAARPAAAIHAYLDLSPHERRQVPVETVAALGDWLARAGQPDAALALYRQGLDDHPRSARADRLFLGIGLTLLRGKGRPTAAYQYLLDALDAATSGEIRTEAKVALREIEKLQKLPVRDRRR